MEGGARNRGDAHQKLLTCTNSFVNKMAIETDSPSIPTIEESEVGRGGRLFDIMVKWVGGGCVLERGRLFEKKRYSQGYLDYIHKYIVLSTHKKT